MGTAYYAFREITKNPSLLFIYNLQDWNAYILVGGLIIFGIGLYYIYSYLKKRNFLLKELKTDKRSEILKKRNELKNTAKHLPSKYQRMLIDKEDELGIK
jgi:putative Mn2+ efflux pump MntP